MEILLRYRKGEYSHSISPSRDDSTSPGATADAVVDVQGGSGRRVPQEAKLGRTATPAPECGQAKLRVKFIGREYN